MILALAMSLSSFVYADCPCRLNDKSCPEYTCPAVTGKGPCNCGFKVMPKGELLGTTITIPAKIEVKKPGRIKEIAANTTGDNVEWIVYPDDDVDLITKDDSGKKVLFSTSTEGTYYLTAITASYDDTTKKTRVVKSNTCIIIVGQGKPPDNPPDNPDVLDSFQTKLKAEYIKLGKPQADLTAVANWYSDAITLINEKNVVNTQALDMSLKSSANGILGNKVQSIRDLNAEYLKSKLNVNPLTLTDEVRALWTKEFKYVGESLKKVAK